MITPIETTPRGISTWSILLSVLLIILGVLAIALPAVTSIGVTLLVGWLLLFAGVVQLVHAFQSTGIGHILWKFLIAACYLITAFFLLSHPVLGLVSLTLALAAFFFAAGVVDIIAYFSTRKGGTSGWLLVDGIATLVLGFLIWNRWPAASLWVVGALVGVGMIMSGITRLMMALAFRKGVKELSENPFQRPRAA